MDPVTLCAGTLEVEQPDHVLLDYLDPRNGYAYPAYDLLVTNGSTELVERPFRPKRGAYHDHGHGHGHG